MNQPEEQFQDVREIVTLTEAKEANAYLKRGWRSLKVLTKRDEDEHTQFVLGWYQEGDPVHY